MKDICHKGLAKLIGRYGSNPLEPWVLEILIDSAVEPDETNKQMIAEEIINILTIPIEWLVDHTIKAKVLAIRCIWEAYNAKHNNNHSWPRYLGWAFHYIADWGTPHHSPVSRSNPIPAFAGAGAIIGGIIGGITESGGDLGEVLLGIAKGALVGAGISGVAGLICLAIEHNEFEIRCDERWEKHANLIMDRFKAIRGDQQIPKQLGQALELLEQRMDILRQKCNNLSANWIYSSNESEFAEYMAQIAIIMDFACQIIMR